MYPGTLTRLQWLNEEQVELLKDGGAIGEVQPPPLKVLPGWKRRAALLKKQGIVDAAQFLEASSEEMATALKMKEVTVERWKREITNWLTAPSPTGG